MPEDCGIVMKYHYNKLVISDLTFCLQELLIVLSVIIFIADIKGYQSFNMAYSTENDAVVKVSF